LRRFPLKLLAGRIYRAFYLDDTFRMTNKLTLNLGLRYELQGTWSERFNRLPSGIPRPRMPPETLRTACGHVDRTFRRNLVTVAFVAEDSRR